MSRLRERVERLERERLSQAEMAAIERAARWCDVPMAEVERDYRRLRDSIGSRVTRAGAEGLAALDRIAPDRLWSEAEAMASAIAALNAAGGALWEAAMPRMVDKLSPSARDRLRELVDDALEGDDHEG